MIGRFFVLLSLFVFIRCNHLPLSSEKKECVVKYKEDCLTKEEINSMLQDISPQDSEWIARQFVNEWIAERVLYDKAKKEVLINDEELEKYLNDTKRQYYVAAFIKKYVRENVDTSVSDKQILEYYQLHRNSFKLANNIVQIYYVKLNDNEKDEREFKKLLSLTTKDKNKLNNFILERANGYFIEDSLWLKWEDVTKEISVLKNYEIHSLPKGKIIEWRDGTFYYYIKIKDYKVKNEYSPVVYEKEKIKKIILSERKNKSIHELKSKVLVESDYVKK